MADDLKKTGIQLVAEGSKEFKQAVDGANDSMSKMGESAQRAGGGIDALGAVATGALLAIRALAVQGVMKLGAALGDFIQDAMEGEKLIARLNSVITATGGAAGISMEAAQKLADQYKDLAGGSDEAVLAIEEMALRMGTVSADQMPGFIQTTLDLAAITGTDATNAARLLAQAYDDPTSAMMRFNKMGINFDTQLEQQIKDLVKAGKSGEAYNLMMERLGQATKGAAAGQAETLAGQIGIMKEHLADAGKAIGEAFLPLLKDLFETYIVPNIPKIEAFARAIADFISGIVGSGDPLAAFGQAIMNMLPENVRSAIDGLIAAFQTQLLPLLSELWNILSGGGGATGSQLGAFFTDVLLPALSSFGAWAQANILPLLQQFWEWLQVNLPIAVQTLVNFWNTVLLPALINWWTFLLTNVFPVLGQLWAWLAANLPVAIQTLSNFWNTVLLPAITSVVAWVTGTLIPTLLKIWDWLQVTIPAALQTLSNFWTTVLLPAITAVWSWLNTVLFPFFQALVDFFTAVFDVALTASAGLWQNVLLPAITAVWSWFSEKILPVLTAIADFLVKVFTPAFDALRLFFENVFSKVLKAVHDAFQGISDVISGITGAISRMAESLRNITLPAWLTPGSPTPFELGLMGIANALAAVNAQLPNLDMNISAVGRSAGQTVNNMQTFSTTNQYNYAPTYGGTPYNPSMDFAIMQVMAA